MKRRITFYLIIWGIFFSCSVNKKIKNIHQNLIIPEVVLNNYQKDTLEFNSVDLNYTTNLTEEQSIIMNAVIDDQTGQMIATDKLDEIFVRATFRNVAERNGKVDLGFEIIVPSSLADENWQLRFQPKFIIMGDTLYSDKVLITGNKFRQQQIKGYDQYGKYLNSIIPDTVDFITNFCYDGLMQDFITRREKKDSLWLNAAELDSRILDYYTKNWKYRNNQRRKEKSDYFFKKFVKTPFLEEGVKLDSIIKDISGNIKYYYVQQINIKKNLKRVDMVLGGDIRSFEKQLYEFPKLNPLTFYISSLTNLIDNKQPFIYNVIERNLVVNTSAYIDFKSGNYNIIDTLHNNLEELTRIKDNIDNILSDTTLGIDSLIITAACSPEGPLANNKKLAIKRGESVKNYLLESLDDSINVKVAGIAEDWTRLKRLIYSDSNLVDRDYLLECFDIDELDERERRMMAGKDYVYLRSTLYPYLRCVKLDFHLYKKGMLKDTIHTKELDLIYLKGVDNLKNGNYKDALNLLRGYKDINSALAYLSLDYNYSALEILDNLSDNSKKEYLLAIVYSRLKDEKKALSHFANACLLDNSMKFRGNLDPEIKNLIDKYKNN